jgi:hypothetical protein
MVRLRLAAVQVWIVEISLGQFAAPIAGHRGHLPPETAWRRAKRRWVVAAVLRVV